VTLLALGLVPGCAGPSGLEVSVSDSAGNPLWGAKVISMTQPAGQLKLTALTTQESNTVAFRDIAPGTYTVQVSRFDYAPKEVVAVVRAGRISRITVRLEDG
jgi:hypothetical protein